MPVPSVYASVAFLKIHDFGRRPVVEQARLRAQLEAVVAVTLPALGAADRVLLDAADGIALVVLGDPGAALDVAERALAAGAAGLPLAVGVTHGAVRPTGSGPAAGLMGDGIAVAAAIAEVAGPQKLLATREFCAALADAAPGAEARLAPAGTHTDAGLRAHELYRSAPRGLARRARRYTAATVAAALVLLGSGVAWRASEEGPERFAQRVGGALQAGAARALDEAGSLITRAAR
ncbi:MAG: hypothetical protein AB7S87_06635 [Burkholderiales bacterium]